MTKNGFDWTTLAGGTSAPASPSAGGSQAPAASSNTEEQSGGFMSGGFWSSLLKIGDTPEGTEVKQVVDVNSILNQAIASKNKTNPTYIILGVLSAIAVIVLIVVIVKNAKKS